MRRVPGAGQRVLGVVEAGGREPDGARHAAVGEHRPVAAVTDHPGERPQLVPELVQVVDRPAPDVLRIGAGLPDRLEEAGHDRALRGARSDGSHSSVPSSTMSVRPTTAAA